MGIVGELQRRNVFRVALAYIVTSWLLIQVADVVMDSIGAPEWVMRALLFLLFAGFVPTLLFAWAFEITPEGIKLEKDVDRSRSIASHTGHKLDILIIVMLVAIGGYVFWESRLREAAPAAHTAARESTGAVATGDKSIAVLPFVNLSSDPEQEYFSDGISEELLNVLAQFPDLRVAARTSSFQFKGDNRDISEIAGLLKVNHVLEGSVRKAGTRLRITAQLIEARNGYHLWSQTYDRELRDVFAIQDEISAAIGDALRAQLKLGEDQQAAAPRVAEASNTAAYEAYLKGRYLVNQRGNRAIAEAAYELERAVRLDPNYAPAQAQLAIALALLHNSPTTYGDLTTAEVNARAVPHADKAMELNPALPEAWGARTIIAMANNDSVAAIEYAKHALSLSPIYADALNWKQNSANDLGLYREAEESLRRLIDVDPLSVVGRINFLGNYLSVSDPASAREQALAMAEKHPWAGYITLSNIASRQGQLAESLQWKLRGFAYDPLDRFSNQGIVQDFCELGLAEEARRVSDATLYLAEALCGDADTARRLLERELVSDPTNPNLLRTLLDVLYLQADYDEMLRRFRAMQLDTPGQREMFSIFYARNLMRLGWIMRGKGEQQAAQELFARADADIEARLAASGSDTGDRAAYDSALRAALDGDDDGALSYLQASIDAGNRNLRSFDEPIFAPLRDNGRLQALEAKMRAYVDAERAITFEMICRNNPIPESWQPLPETCQAL